MLRYEKHTQSPIPVSAVEGKTFEFYGKLGARFFHTPPTRCFLVEDIDGKWLHWGKIFMLEQTIRGASEAERTTAGKYIIVELYDPEYQKLVTKRESPQGKSFL